MIKFIIREAWNRRGFNIWIINEIENHRYFFAEPFEIKFSDKPQDGASILPEPTFFLKDCDFQTIRTSVINELTQSGIEPLAIAKEAELKATKYHLEDFRRLVFEENK